MFAASLLVVAVMATYASLAAISLTGGGSLPLPNFAGRVVDGVVGTVTWQPPAAKQVIHVRSSVPGQIRPFGDVPYFDLGSFSSEGGSTRQLSLTNTSSATLPLTLGVDATPGIAAAFDTGGARTVVHPRHAARINVTSDPMHAGPITGTLTVAIANSPAGAYTIHLTGAQAPLPSPSLTATPAAGGAVQLAWTPSPSSGVSGYVVQRTAVATGAVQTVATLPATATSAVDKTTADGTYTYQVTAQAPGATSAAAPVSSSPGPQATAVADDTAPAPPTGIAPPPLINAGDVTNGNAITVPVELENDSSATDTITVTLTDSNGVTATGTAPGGVPTANVSVTGVGKLADGSITVSATAADSLGNTSKPFVADQPIWKDVVGPPPPTVSVDGEITLANAASFPVTVSTEAAAAGGATVNVTITDGVNNTATGKQTENAGDTSAVVDVGAGKLADGTDLVATATVTDEAGNVSLPSAPVPVVKDTTPSPGPTSFGVAVGPENPAGVVTAASAHAVIVQATFDQPPPADDRITVWVNKVKYPLTPDGQSTTYTIGPLDLSDLSDGQYKLGLQETDPAGNETNDWKTFTVDTGGATAPTGVGVPAGPDNPAGYVNAATQTAATIVASFAGPTDPADQISLSVGGMALPVQSGGGDRLSWTADLSGLPDGTLPISGTIVDGNGVTSTFSGSLIKDTDAPPAPAVASVLGPPPNTISPSGASCVKVLVAFNQAPDPDDAVTVSLSDGGTSVQGSASAGDGHVVVGCIDASSLAAGTVSVSVTVTDAAGNSTDFTGTPAVLLACTHGPGSGASQSPDQ